jgi:hypothetical protein
MYALFATSESAAHRFWLYILMLTSKRKQEARARMVSGVDLPREHRVLDDDQDRAALPNLCA